MFFKTGVLKNFVIFTDIHLCWDLFLEKRTPKKNSKNNKKRLQHMSFPKNNAKFLRTAFLKNTSDGCFYVWYVFIINLEQISHIAQVMFGLTSTWSLSGVFRHFYILVICLIWMKGFLSANAVRSGGPFFFTLLCNSKIMKNSVKPLRKLLNVLNLIFLNFGNSTFVSSDELLVHFSATIHFYTT